MGTNSLGATLNTRPYDVRYIYLTSYIGRKKQFLERPRKPKAGLNRAFSSKQRESTFIVTHEETRIMLLSGKDTNRLGVQEITGDQGERIDLTNLERTLIDIAVCPAYAGGTQNVLFSYSRAIQKISVDLLVEMLEDLDYLYPYPFALCL